MPIDEAMLEKLLGEHLPAQRWFGARMVDGLIATRELTDRLLQVLVRGSDGGRYQAVIGLRPIGDLPGFFDGKAGAVIGELDGHLAYDATIDPELSIALLAHVMPDEHVERARPLGAEQTNTSLVFDERLVLKVFRRLSDGPNPDVEVTRELARIGFEHVIPPLAEWRDADGDYGVVNELLVGAFDGWHLALTSLRDLYDRRCEPDEAPGDFGFEAERLGAVTARLHVAMADAFGTHPADVDGWIDDMESQLARVDLPSKVAKGARSTYHSLRDVEVGPAIRIHGDFHLGQTLRTDNGWFVLDFEGEPARPVEERTLPSSPMRDVAGMLRSFSYAAQVALREHAGNDEEATELQVLADSWERHNARRFLEGYEGYGDVDHVLPSRDARAVVRRAFELDKAVYEVDYETGHRPDWVEIPRAAVTRLLEGGPT
jgi:maltokinase